MTTSPDNKLEDPAAALSRMFAGEQSLYFPNPGYREILACNQIKNFDDLWNLELDWVEEPNVRRSGWSRIGKTELRLPDGGTLKIYIKRQSGHNYRTLRHPLTGVPTFRREYLNLQALQRIGVHGATILCYGERHQLDAVLVLESLEEFTDMDDWNKNHAGQLPPEEVKATLHEVAAALYRIHQGHYQYGCLYGKHIFIRISRDLPQDRVRFIDLEKMHRGLSVRTSISRDMRQFIRRSNYWQPGHLEMLLQDYADMYADPEMILSMLS
jgi:hypothetical protein